MARSWIITMFLATFVYALGGSRGCSAALTLASSRTRYRILAIAYHATVADDGFVIFAGSLQGALAAGEQQNSADFASRLSAMCP